MAKIEWQNLFTNMMPHGLVRLFNRNYNPARNYNFGQEQAVWLDTCKPYELFEGIPQLKTVISKKAKMFSNIEWKLFDKKTGKDLEDVELMTLLKNPNVMKSGNNWLEEFKMQEQVYGNQFMYKFKPTGLTNYPQALWNISARYMQPVTSGKVFKQTELDKIIIRYDFIDGGKKESFNTNEIMYTAINDLDNPVIGTSIINSLSKVLTNIDLAYQYRNIIMKKRGALGVLSRDAKDTTGALTFDKDGIKKDLHAQYQEQYGIGDNQMQIFLTDTALKWQAMSYPTKDLLLFEEIDANTLAIIDAFGMNANIFSTKVATFENVKQSLISVYQDTIIPEADKFAQSLSKFLNLPDNYNLVASYDHIEILKQNTNYNDVYPLVSLLTNAIQNQILTVPQATTILQNELGKYFNVDGVF